MPFYTRQTLSSRALLTFEHSFTHVQEMADKLLFGTAERIIDTLTSLVSKEIGLLWGVEDQLKSLMNTVSTIKAVLLDAEEKQAARDHVVKDWLGKLKDVIYDAEDLLDDVSTEVLRREMMTHDHVSKKVRVLFSKSNPLYHRYETAHKIEAMRKRLDAINADRERFHLVVRDAETRVGNRLHASRETYSFVRAESVIGREDDKRNVIHRLMDFKVEENVSILPIVALGGLGKTSLAQLIFNDEQIQNHFELKMWVCVSDPFHVKDIVEKILESATNKKQQDVQMNTLVNYLRQEINGKKYLLVLDDVWNEDHRKWSDLKEVLMGGAKGSRILVTTRTERVARICGTVDSYSLMGLNELASWSLFVQMAFEKGHEPEENSSIAATGREILQKCSGVPLAIRTIGSLLRFKNSETEWLNFKNDELSKIPQNETDILPTLKLSYDQLQSHLKHCFAYCSLFPKDYEFERSTLIRLWIAQGFVKSSDQHRCLEDVGNEYFMDLLWRSFFQEAKKDEFGNVSQCKMHDLMHDLAISEAGSLITTFNDRERNFDEKTRHVSIGCSVNALSITTSLCKASGIRSFLCLNPNLCEVDESCCEAIVSSFKFLRTLVLRRQGKLCFVPCCIGNLKHLRYIDLSYNSELKKLPNSITELQNLQTLMLVRCYNLEELPKDMQKLVNLRHLDIDLCPELTYMPRGLGKLTNLQTLSTFVVHWDPLSNDSSGLKELHGLNNLRGKLEIVNLRYVKDVASECKAANLKGKEHLHALTLQWCFGQGVNDSDVDVDAELLLEDLQPHPNLKEIGFLLYDCKSLRLPSWLSSLTNLVRFELYGLMECKYMPPLSQLPSLKYLSLGFLEAMEYITTSNEFYSSSSAPIPFFPSLKEIKLLGCHILKGWWRRMRHSSVEEVNSDGDNYVEVTAVTSMTEHCLLPSFPCLSTLEISNCPMLTSMPMFPHLERQLVMRNTSSKLLQQTMMMNMAAPQSPTPTTFSSSSSTLSKLKLIQLSDIVDLETLPEEWLKNLTSLESLSVSDCNRLKSISQGIQHLTALHELKIVNCPELELANDEDGMQWHGLKSLFSLSFSNLPKLVSLPLGLQHVTTLQNLEISSCYSLTAIPEWIQYCTSLQVFKICHCFSLTSLPEGMRGLTSLQRLKIEYASPILLRRCKREVGEDWPKIAHIPNLELLNINLFA
jgi:Leucine-rich repeat (LRR) protein